MPTVLRTPEAAADLVDIWSYVARDDVMAADRLVAAIEEKFNTLSQFPLMGRAGPEFSANLRSFPIRNYLIFYRPIKNGVDIIRIISGARDIDSLF